MSEHKNIRLLVQEDGGTVWRTLKGELLVGALTDDCRPLLSYQADYEQRERWGFDMWYVIRSTSGKLVVYRQPMLNEDGPPTVTVYDSFEAMQPHVPPNIYNTAMEKAGLKPPPQFPELPLEGV
jgi:hypothetical protein